MIKYFIKNYGRYIAMALAFATVSFLLNSCKVKAETNYNQSITLSYSETTNSTDRVLYNDPNNTNKAFANAGRGYLIGIISSYRYMTGASFEIPTVYSINARTDSGYSTCEVSSLSNDMSDSTQMKANLYGFKCDLTMGTNGLISLSVNFKPSVSNAWTVESYRLTFNNNLQAQEVQYSQYLYDYMQNYVYPRLNGIENNTGATAQELQWIYQYLQNYIYTALNGTTSAINNQTQQQHQDAQSQKDSTDAINDSLNNGDTSSVSLDTITGQTTDVGAISGLITIPLTLLSSVITAFNGTCISYNIGTLFNTNLIFPCIDLESILGSFLWDTIDIMITGIFIFYISKKFINLFNKLINLENIRLGVVDFV